MSILRRGFALSVLLVAAICPAAFAQTQAYPLLQQQGLQHSGSGPVGLAAQGAAVAISADGNTAVIGGPTDNSNIGGIWVFKRTGSTWTQQGTELIGTSATGAAKQGTSVAINGDGTKIIEGGPADNSNTGGAWVFVLTSEGFWAQQGSELIGTGATGAAAQGTSVAISGDGTVAMLGGPADNSNAGAAWVFAFNGSSWSQSGSKLVGGSAIGAAQQGTSVALASNGLLALVGGPGDNDGVGAAWIFRNNSGAWANGKHVGTSSTGASAQGTSVALSGDGWVAAVGGPANNSNVGAVWIYTQAAGVFTQQAKVTASDGTGASKLGSSLAMSRDGGSIVAGGPGDNTNNGAVWMFGRTSVTSWGQQGSKRVASDAGSGAKFGSAAGISADGTAAIFGASNQASAAGAFWAFNDNIFFGGVNVGANTTQTISLQPSTNFTIGNVLVVTQGLANMDFTIAASQPSSDACQIDASITNGSPTCSINVKFAPTAPGVRMGAIQIYDDEAFLVATVYLYGAGQSPQVGFNSALINTVAGNGTSGFSGDTGPATAAEMASTWGVSADPAGNLFIADYDNDVIRFVAASTGDISTIVGTPETAGSTGDGGAATAAELHGPETPVLDGAGNLYIDDYRNQKVRVVDPVNLLISTYAGNGTAANSGDGGLAVNAEFEYPYAVMIGNNGDVYIADADGEAVRRISAITGIVTAVAGTGTEGYSGDGGPATSATLDAPLATAMDASGNLYISDDSNEVIREVNYATGTITTVAGNSEAGSGFAGDGGPATSAQISDAEGLGLDPAGDLYITDSGNNAVREVNVNTQIINSIAGDGNAEDEAYSGDGGPATAALLAYPVMPGFDGAGNFYFSDSDNNVIRVIGAAPPLDFGTINVGDTSAAQDIAVTNNGNTVLTFTTMSASANFDLNGPDTTCTVDTQLQPGVSCVLSVEFTPTSSGFTEGSVSLADNDPTHTQQIPLSGTGALATPTIALTATPQSANLNQSVTFTATLNPIPAAPRGTVEFCDITNQDVSPIRPAEFAPGTRRGPTPIPADGIFANCDGGTLLGTGNVGSDGTATLNFSTLTAGTHIIVAIYSGNAGFAEALSDSISEMISSVIGTTTTLSAQPTAAAVGQTVTFTATVAPAPTGSPLGSVNFCLGPTDTIARPASLISRAPSAAARRVRPVPDGPACGGGTLLMNVTISGSGVATFDTSSLALGSNVITAVYLGNDGFAGSVSNSVTVVISNATATTTALTISPNPANAGQTVTLTGKVTPAPTGSPLGTITFCLGDINDAAQTAAARAHVAAASGRRVSAALPAPAEQSSPCGSATVLNTSNIDSTGAATFMSSTLSSGSLILTAVYSGNATSEASTSDPVTEVINPAFTVTAPQSPFDVPEGGSVPITVTVPPLGGSFTNVVTLSATGLPPGATATFNPPMVTPGSAGAQTIMTVVLAGGKSSANEIPSAPPAGPLAPVAGTFAGLCLLAGILSAGSRGTARRRLAALVILLAAVTGSIALLSACSGGFAGGAATPKGAYTITVTGTSGSLQASTTVNLVVE